MFFVIYFVVIFVQINEIWSEILIADVFGFFEIVFLFFMISLLLILNLEILRIIRTLLKFAVYRMLRFVKICEFYKFWKIFHIFEFLTIFLLIMFDRLILIFWSSWFRNILWSITTVWIEIWNIIWTKKVFTIVFERFRNIVKFENFFRLLILICSIIEVFKDS